MPAGATSRSSPRLFFGLKAAVLAIVVEAVVRIGRRALKNQALIGLAAAAFVGIFFFNVPFPIIVFAAALIGFVGGAMGVDRVPGRRRPWASKTAGGQPVVDSLLGEQLPEHARPTVVRALKVSGVWLALWLIPVARTAVVFRQLITSSARSRSSSAKWRW